MNIAFHWYNCVLRIKQSSLGYSTKIRADYLDAQTSQWEQMLRQNGVAVGLDELTDTVELLAPCFAMAMKPFPLSTFPILASSTQSTTLSREMQRLAKR